MGDSSYFEITFFAGIHSVGSDLVMRCHGGRFQELIGVCGNKDLRNLIGMWEQS